MQKVLIFIVVYCILYFIQSQKKDIFINFLKHFFLLPTTHRRCHQGVPILRIRRKDLSFATNSYISASLGWRPLIFQTWFFINFFFGTFFLAAYSRPPYRVFKLFLYIDQLRYFDISNYSFCYNI